jgi:hypothetical protein
MAEEETLRAGIRSNPPKSYDDLVERLVATLANASKDEEDLWVGNPDPKRIHVIDDGHYQGTRLFIIGTEGYQPDSYWSIYVNYGSCSGCDTFEAIEVRGVDTDYSTDPWTETVSDRAVQDFWTLMLHMVQSMEKV